jgi:hypothetical protein
VILRHPRLESSSTAHTSESADVSTGEAADHLRPPPDLDEVRSSRLVLRIRLRCAEGKQVADERVELPLDHRPPRDRRRGSRRRARAGRRWLPRPGLLRRGSAGSAPSAPGVGHLVLERLLQDQPGAEVGRSSRSDRAHHRRRRRSGRARGGAARSGLCSPSGRTSSSAARSTRRLRPIHFPRLTGRDPQRAVDTYVEGGGGGVSFARIVPSFTPG